MNDKDIPPDFSDSGLIEDIYIQNMLCFEPQKDQIDLLADLQCLHDYSPPPDWRSELVNIAKRWSLSSSVCDVQ